MVVGSACGVSGPVRPCKLQPGATRKRTGLAGTFEKPELTTQRDGLIEHLDDLEAEVQSLLPLLDEEVNSSTRFLELMSVGEGRYLR